jgi:hypothetical protein
VFLNCSLYFEGHTAHHHQDLKYCNCSLWYYICLWLPAVVNDNCRQPQTYVKPEAAITVFELLMMGGVSLETCWAIKKHWNNTFYYTVAFCWLFLYDLCGASYCRRSVPVHQTKLPRYDRVYPATCDKRQDVQFHLFFTSLSGGEWSDSEPGRAPKT